MIKVNKLDGVTRRISGRVMSESLEIEIRGTSIDLDQFLKLSGVASSGGEAKYFIKEGLVQVNEEPEERRRRKLAPGDMVTVDDIGDFTVISNNQ